MSVFKVTLNNTAQGLLDGYVVGTAWHQADVYTSNTTADTFDATNGVYPSLQRQVWIMGPHRINRLLKDGAVFTDCNYWKRFCYPQCPLEQAILTCVSDDGSVWVDGTNDSTYPLVYSLTCVAGHAMGADTGSIANIFADTGGYAVFCQITNPATGDDITVRINGTATFTLEHGSTQVFNVGDLLISKIEVANAASGADESPIVEVLCSVKSVATS
jgi:hypothetical protein